MKRRLSAWGVLVFLFGIPMSDASAHQDPALVKNAVDSYLRGQVQGLPGEVSYTISGVDPKNRLMPCTELEVSQPSGSKSWGRTSVSVRCRAEHGWTIFVPVHIRVITEYLVTAAPLAQGKTIAAGDLSRQRGDLSDLPAGVLTDEQEALGRTTAYSIGAGRPLRADMMRQPVVIQQNQTVKVVSRGSGFQVTNEGKALNNAQDGQIVQIRLNNGQIISGVARPGGFVEIAF
jgi:flagellar basal body P-ring formation protein FlgA